MSRPATLWVRRLPTGNRWYPNHFEEGHADTLFPAGSNLQLKLWASSKWMRVHGWIEGEYFRDVNGNLSKIDSVYNGDRNGV